MILLDFNEAASAVLKRFAKAANSPRNVGKTGGSVNVFYKCNGKVYYLYSELEKSTSCSITSADIKSCSVKMIQ